jgi:hypothetical protein
MAQVEEGDRVKISYICRLEDGTIYDFSERDSLEFIVGEGGLPPELEKGVLGMSIGERKVVRVPAAEVEEFRFVEEGAPNMERFPAGTSPGDEEEYDIGPGEEGDDDEEPSTEALHLETMSRRPPGEPEELIFEIVLLEMEPDGGLFLGESEE